MSDRNKIAEIIELFFHAPKSNLRLELLELFFTPNEIEQLVARYEIIQGLLNEKLTQRELAAHLNISIAKITRGSNELKRRSPPLLAYLRKNFSQPKGKNK